MQSTSSERPGAPFPKQFRLKHTRSKTGCLPCRQRKKKCDETRPCCSACRRNSLGCEWSDQSRAPTRNSRSWSIASLSPLNHLVFAGISRACEFTPESFKLLEHYRSVTAVLLPAWTQTQTRNPFISRVLPLAYDDDLLMHAVLAVSGAHLSHKLAGIVSVKRATYMHYSLVLRELRHAIGRGQSGEMDGIMRLLSVLAFLCLYEILAGSAHAIFSLHLQAIQHTFSQLCSVGAAASAQSDEINDMLSWIYDGYSYMALCNLIIPTPQPRYSTEFISIVPPTLGLRLSQPLSNIFGGSRNLFEMIPRANALFCCRLAEQSMGEIEPTPAFLDRYAELDLAIETWRSASPPYPPNDGRSSKNDHTDFSEWIQSNMAAEFIRHALRIYMVTARLGSSPPTPGIESAIQTNVEAMVRISRTIAATPCASNLMWAVIVGGSCVRDENYRQELAYWLKTSHYQMRHLTLVLSVLELLWADPSANAFGPYGLYYTSRKHNLEICIM